MQSDPGSASGRKRGGQIARLAGCVGVRVIGSRDEFLSGIRVADRFQGGRCTSITHMVRDEIDAGERWHGLVCMKDHFVSEHVHGVQRNGVGLS